jgi:hypothetical protein
MSRRAWHAGGFARLQSRGCCRPDGRVSNGTDGPDVRAASNSGSYIRGRRVDSPVRYPAGACGCRWEGLKTDEGRGRERGRRRYRRDAGE